MENAYKYRATAYWILSRRGIVSAEDVPQAIEFSAPPEFEGEYEMWTPEHFFMAAVASCFVSTFRALSEFSKFDTVALDVGTEGTMARGDGGFRFEQIIIRPILTVASEEEKERGRKLLEKAERVCPITRSLSCKVTLEPTVQLSASVSA